MTQTTPIRLSRRNLIAGASLAAVGAAGLVGCTAASGPPGSSPSPTGGTSTAVMPDHVPYEGVAADLPRTPEGGSPGFLAYPESPVSATSGKPASRPITAMTYTYATAAPGLASNIWQQQLNERLGAELDITYLPAAEYPSKFATATAGGDIPDIVGYRTEPNPPAGLPDLLRARFEELSPYLGGTKAADYPFLANLSPGNWAGAAGDGLYMIPVARPIVGNYSFIRTDLVEALGMDPQPNSFAEFMDLCRAFTDERKGMWAMNDPANVLGFIQQMLGVVQGWKQEGGQFTAGIETDETAKAVDSVRQMWSEGLFNPDSFAPGGGGGISQGKLMMAWGSASYLSPVRDLDDPLGQMGVVIEPGYDGGPGHHWQGRGAIGYVSLKKAAPDKIEELLRVLNHLAAPFGTEEYLFNRYGIEDRHWKWVDGDLETIGDNLGELNYPSRYLVEAEQVLYHPGHPEYTETHYEIQNKVVPLLLTSDEVGLYSATAGKSGPTIDGYLADAWRNIITGRDDMSTWTDAVAKWRTDGGDQIRAEYEESYAAVHG